ncbi:MAG TPA: hypothetical protein VMB21_03920 [Candidatus Limnocylindria bacterium]|nr:hypothetical protein [Candidatus Limnocylindria bacterium]
MKKTLLTLLLLVGALAARASTTVLSVDNIAALTALPTNGTPVEVLGYYNPNDGGGGLFTLTNSATGINYGTMFASSVTGYSWQRILGSTLDIRQFGATTNLADNAPYIKDAVAVAEAKSLDVLVPIGYWTNKSTITLTRSWLHGIKTEHARATGTNQSVLVFDLDPTASTEGVRLTATGPDTGQPRLSDLWLTSPNRNNSIAKQAITGVASRLQFTVAAASAPTLPDTGGTNIYPYAGVAFFFTPGSNYLGSAVISSFATAGATTTINLHPDYDWFATPTNNSRMLTTNCTVIFAPITVCADGVHRVDPSLVGPAGVRIAGGSPLGLTIDNVGVFNFWTGCTFANAGSSAATYVPRMGDFTAAHCVWHGLGKDVRGGGTGAFDWYQSGLLFVDGYGGSFEIDVDEREYARCAFGLWCPPNTAELDTIVTDGCLNGLLQYSTSGTKITKAFFDNTGLNGLIWQHGVDSSSADDWLSIGQLCIERPLDSVTYSIQRTNKYGIWLNVNPVSNYYARLNIGSLSWGTVAGTNRLFDAAFNLTGGNPCLSIGMLTPDNGHAYATMLAPGSATPFIVSNQSGSTALPGFTFDATGTAPVWNAKASTVFNAPKLGFGDFSATPSGVFNSPFHVRLPNGYHFKLNTNYLAGTSVQTVRMSASDESFNPQPFKFQALSHNFTTDSDNSYVFVLTNNTAKVNGTLTVNGAVTVNSSLTTTGAVRLPAGSSSVSAIGPSADTGTGLSFPGAGTINFLDGGAVAGAFNANGHLLVGTGTDNGTGSILQTVVSGGNSSLDMTVYGGDAGSIYRLASGSVGAPGATTSGQIARSLSAAGTTNGTTWAVGARVEAVATRTWDTSGYGMRLGFHVTPNATVGSTVEALRIDQDSSVQALAGDVKINTAGKGLFVKSGTNCKLGACTLSGGTVTVGNTSITANSVVFFTLTGASGTIGIAPYVTSVTAGTGFNVQAGPSDNSTYKYFIVEAQ